MDTARNGRNGGRSTYATSPLRKHASVRRHSTLTPSECAVYNTNTKIPNANSKRFLKCFFLFLTAKLPVVQGTAKHIIRLWSGDHVSFLFVSSIFVSEAN